MEGQKIIQLLNVLSKPELNRLEKLVFSPFFNKNQHVIDLFLFLKPFYPSFDQSELTKEHIYQSLFPKDKYKDSRLRNIMSDLTKLVEQFIIWEELNNQSLLQTQHLLKVAKERDIDKYYEPSLKKWAQMQRDYPYRDVLYYFNQHQLQEERYEFTTRKDNRAMEQSLQQLTDNLDIYYLSKKLKYCCEMINRTNVFSEQYEMGLFDEVMTYLNRRTFEEVPIIRIYYQILLTLLKGEDEAHYFELKRLLAEHTHLFPQMENKTNYSFAQNYCIKKINSGQSEYLKELFELYKLSLENKVIFEGELLSQWDYKNITTVGLRLEEHEWTMQFLDDYEPFIDKRHRENAYKYNKANAHFYQKEFKKAMLLLLQVEFTDIYYNLDSRSLLAKVYFELEEFEAMFTHMDTFKNYLRRNEKISGYQKKVYKNLLKYMMSLAKLKLAKKNIPPGLAEEINTTPQIADATWLRKKVANWPSPGNRKLT